MSEKKNIELVVQGKQIVIKDDDCWARVKDDENATIEQKLLHRMALEIVNLRAKSILE